MHDMVPIRADGTEFSETGKTKMNGLGMLKSTYGKKNMVYGKTTDLLGVGPYAT